MKSASFRNHVKDKLQILHESVVVGGVIPVFEIHERRFSSSAARRPQRVMMMRQTPQRSRPGMQRVLRVTRVMSTSRLTVWG